jgi:RING-type zinc-finger
MPGDHARFLEYEDLVYGYTRRMHQLEEDSGEEDEELDGHGRRQTSLTCPVCKTVHAPVSAPLATTSTSTRTCTAATTTTTNNNNDNMTLYSHDARVIFASFACPICLEDTAGPPMVVLPCGHGICEDDFRLLGGQTAKDQKEHQDRQAAERQETWQRGQRQSNNNNSNDIVPFGTHLERTILGVMLRSDYANDRSTAVNPESFLAFLDRYHPINTNNNNNNNNNPLDWANATLAAAGPALSTRPTVPFGADRQGGEDDDEEEEENSQDDDDDDDDDYDDDDDRLQAYLDDNFYDEEVDDYYAHFYYDGSGFHNDSDDDADEVDIDADAFFETPNAMWGLTQYHPGNAVDANEVVSPRVVLPKVGQWLLVPDDYLAHFNRNVNLVYYCEYARQQGVCINNLQVVQQYPKGTRLIPNKNHGVYIHTPPSSSSAATAAATTTTRRTSNHRHATEAVQRTNDQWMVYYAGNLKCHEPGPSHDRRCRPPYFRYNLHKHAKMVPDGKGGIWALHPESSLPDSVRRSSTLASEDTNDTNPTTITDTARRQRRHQRDKRDYLLVHYSREVRDGQVVGKVLPAYCKIFMDKSGGVYLLQPNCNGEQPRPSSFCSLWHVSLNQGPTLLYGGIRRETTKVMGDSSGSSVFILSAGGRLQSILTRVQVESDPTLSVVAGAVHSTTCFSYDLDIPVDDIQDVVEGPTPKQVYMKCRFLNFEERYRWTLCLVGPAPEERGAQLTERMVYSRHSRIVSDGEGGVWIWKRPSHHINRGDRSLVHASEDDRPWDSPCVFPPRTQLAGLLS